MENAKIEKLKWYIYGDFQTLWFSFKGEICFPIFWIPPFITYVRDPIEIK